MELTPEQQCYADAESLRAALWGQAGVLDVRINAVKPWLVNVIFRGQHLTFKRYAVDPTKPPYWASGTGDAMCRVNTAQPAQVYQWLRAHVGWQIGT